MNARYLVISLFAALIGFVLTMPQSARADSAQCSTAGCTVNANVNLQVVIPGFIRMQIGASGTTSTVTFDYTGNPTAIGTGAPAGSISGGDLGGALITADVFSNAATPSGSLTMTTAVSGLGLGIQCTPAAGSNCTAADHLNWNEIDTQLTSGSVTPPPLNNGGTGTANYPANAGGVVNESATWTYDFLNTAAVLNAPSGTYDGTVTYTIQIP
ncbi:MAG: hypothetical protein ACE5K1_05790 [Acidiferrobacterales bacterium]